MDYKQVEELGGKIVRATVPYSFKTWGNDRSVGGEFAVDVTIGTDADPEATITATYVWLKQLAHSVMKDDLESVRVVTQSAPKQQQQAAPEQAAGVDDVVLDDCRVGHTTFNGKSSLKVFGGQYRKYGVTMWDEIASNYPDLIGYQEWGVTPIGAGGVEDQQYLQPLPDGFTKAIVQVVGGKPKRVLRLE